MYELSDNDIRDYSKKSLRVLTIPFESVINAGDFYVFIKDGTEFTKVSKSFLNKKQRKLFDTIGDSDGRTHN